MGRRSSLRALIACSHALCMRCAKIKIDIFSVHFCSSSEQHKIGIMEMAKMDTFLAEIFGDEKFSELMGKTSRHISSQLVGAGLTVDVLPLAIVIAIAVIALPIFLLSKFDIFDKFC